VAINIEKQVDYWKNSAKEDLKTAKILFTNKRFDACLFFCHLSLEKLIKGLVVIEIKDFPPYIHDLVRLAEIAKLKIDEDMEFELKIFTTFNISGRYKTDKFLFYKSCDRDYSQKYFDKAKNLYLWLRKKYPKKLKRR
jgi:HEPN domain-containing protein